jgi:hypothetical protein
MTVWQSSSSANLYTHLSHSLPIPYTLHPHIHPIPHIISRDGMQRYILQSIILPHLSRTRPKSPLSSHPFSSSPSHYEPASDASTNTSYWSAIPLSNNKYEQELLGLLDKSPAQLTPQERARVFLGLPVEPVAPHAESSAMALKRIIEIHTTGKDEIGVYLPGPCQPFLTF